MTRASVLPALLLAPLLAFSAQARADQTPAHGQATTKPDAIKPGADKSKAAQPPAATSDAATQALMPAVDDFPGFGRLTLPASSHGGYRVNRTTTALIVTRPPNTTLGPLPRLPRNFTSITSAGGAIEIALPRGAKVGIHDIDGKLVINVLDMHPHAGDDRKPIAGDIPATAPAPAAGAAAPSKVEVQKADIQKVGQEKTEPGKADPAKAAAAKVAEAPAKVEPPKAEAMASAPLPELPKLDALIAAGPDVSRPPVAADEVAGLRRIVIGSTAAASAAAPMIAPTPARATSQAAPVSMPPAASVQRQVPGPVAAVPSAAVAPVAVAPIAAAPPSPAPLPALPSAAAASAIPGAIRVERLAGAEPGILLRADRDAGLAAFQLGDEIVVVLDSAIDFQPPGPGIDPVFARLTSSRTQDATVIRIPMAAPAGVQSGTGLHFARDARGWMVVAGASPTPVAGIAPRLTESGPDAAKNSAELRMSASAPSRVVTILDPRTGGRLLVGTQRVPGEAVQTARGDIQFGLLATLQGIAIAPKSDDIALRREADGFVLSAGPHAGGAIISNAAGGPATPPASRLFDIPSDGPAALYAKLKDQIGFAATAPSLARSKPRLRVAETMLGLGMGVEAISVLDVAAADDPTLRDDPKVVGLRAVASILANRPDDAGAIADPRLSGTAEIELWRALLRVAQDHASEQDGRGMAAALPVVLAYPPTLRARLLPTVLETMALNGQAEAAQAALKTLPDDPTLGLARGMAFEMTGKAEDALKEYDRVADRSDRLPRYKALLRAVELRRQGGDLDAKSAADALDRALFAWRDAQQELPLRMRIADLRREAGQWGDSLAMLREAREEFPEDRPRIDRKIAETFTALFSGDAADRIAPSDFVALYDKNIELAKTMTWSEELGTRLVEHLIGLGLQGRAEPIMARMVAQATDPAGRAMMGTRLASIRMTLDDPTGAIAALSDTVPPPGATIDPDVMGARQILYARAEFERGDKDAALAMLGSLNSAEADDIRADIYTQGKDWPHAVDALASLEQKRIAQVSGSSPGSAPSSLTDDQRAIVMRIAEAATLGGDQATLDRLRQTYAAAMAQGDAAPLFRVMTSSPVRGTGDLPRAFEEIQAARRVQANLAVSAQAQP